nr:MAG TPA: hypothetical protein [Caudoviricetes sp.]
MLRYQDSNTDIPTLAAIITQHTALSYFPKSRE